MLGSTSAATDLGSPYRSEGLSGFKALNYAFVTTGLISDLDNTIQIIQPVGENWKAGDQTPLQQLDPHCNPVNCNEGSQGA